MADCKNHGTGKRTQNNIIKNNPSSVFNRSLTVNSSSSSAAVAAVAAAAENRPVYSNSNSQAFQRNGSVKSLHGSSFGSARNSFKGKVWKLCSYFESPKPNLSSTSNSKSSPSHTPKSSKSNKLLLASFDYSNFISKSLPFSELDPPVRLPGTEDRVVIYFTSLRGIRRTFQDCHSVRMIFRGFRINLDERDVSMDVGYRKELQKVLEENNVSLPQVFIKGKYIGGADPVHKLLEAGELARMIKGIPLGSMKPCEACDDMRFVPCSNCSGSRKVFYEYEEQINRCPECNENGLVRCPLCCS